MWNRLAYFMTALFLLPLLLVIVIMIAIFFLILPIIVLIYPQIVMRNEDEREV